MSAGPLGGAKGKEGALKRAEEALEQEQEQAEKGAGPHGPGLSDIEPGGRRVSCDFAPVRSYDYERGGQMDVDLIFKIAAIGILVAVLNQVLSRAGRDEQAMMTTLAGLVVVLMMVVREIAALFTLVKTLFQL